MSEPVSAAPAKIKIAGEIFAVPEPYVEGQPLAANEAHALNQLLHENLRNNFAAKVKKAKDGGTLDLAALQADLDTYAQGYKFGNRSVGTARVTLDPVEREARALAKAAIVDTIKAKGKKLKDYTADQITAAVDTLLAREPKYQLAAEQLVAQRNAVAGAAMDDLLPAQG